MPDYERFVVTGTTTLVPGTYTNPEVYAGNGGAGEVQEGGVMTAITVSISGNTATGNGGAISNSGTATISGSTFSENTSDEAWGGAIDNANILIISDSMFSGNKANGSVGGAIYTTGTVSISGSTFSGNVAGNGGGAIYNGGTVNFTGEVTLGTSSDTIYNDENCILNWDLTGDTTGKLNGYQWLTNDGTLTITVSATQTKATYVLATGDFTTTTNKDTFTIKGVGDTTQNITIGGSATYNGIMYRLYTSGNQLILNSFERFIVGNNQTKTLDAGRTYTNPSVYNGNGGAGEVKSGGVLIGNTVSISGNTASSFGGAIYNYGTASITDSILSGNTASSFGGAICTYGTTIITGSTLSGNTASKNGGAIYNDGTASISGSTLSGNTANYGGAIYNDSYGTVSISGSTLSGNYGTDDIFEVDDLQVVATINDAGGAIENTGDVTITDCLFSRNCFSSTQLYLENDSYNLFIDNTIVGSGAIKT